jgi:hypothetical protein
MDNRRFKADVKARSLRELTLGRGNGQSLIWRRENGVSGGN